MKQNILATKPFSYSLFWLLVCLLIIAQDFAFASIKHTPFYWSEVLLFKIFWLLYIPFTFLVFSFNELIPIKKQNLFQSLPIHILFSIFLTSIQLLLFAILVSAISNLFFDYVFQIYSVFIKTLARDFYLSILVYWLLTFIHYKLFEVKNIEHDFKINTKEKVNFINFINVRKGKDLIPIDVNKINWIDKDGAYIAIHTDKIKYLHNQSLTQIQYSLNPNLFVRIHRSTIVNVKQVAKLKSRSNGDYDVFLQNGKTLRLSRTFRKNLKELF